jgi:alkanesulfonate monooxygenase SsuD/methylene tetrahydromethanopterin reductase-like flavin-dependent oxidoreductase (luciferase family)
MPTSDVTNERPVRVGIRLPRALFENGANDLAEFVRRSEDLGIDKLVIGDHVSFKGGQGFDGLIQAAVLAALSNRITIATSVYLLPLRHPVPVARQVASIAGLAPGRFEFGVGLGGDDPGEVRACGVDPSTRGRRMNESLAIVRALLGGESVTTSGEFFPLDDVTIRPTPVPRVPILVGGRSDAALRRAGRMSEGWIGIWMSLSRLTAAIAEVEQEGLAADRNVEWNHVYVAWCGFADRAEEATALVSDAMERLYQLPFSAFDRYTPRGTPAQVAEALAPYVDAGCRDINLIAVARDPRDTPEHVAEVRRLLQAHGGAKS